MARASTAAALVLTSLAGLARAQGSFADSIEREWAVRAWATDASSAPMFDADDRDHRIARFTASARRSIAMGEALPGVLTDALAVVRRADERADPRELVAALEVLAASRVDDRTPQGDGATLAAPAIVRHRLPTVRLAAARALLGCDEASAALLELARDGDPRVADAALEALLSDAERSPEAVVECWKLTAGSPAAFESFLERLARANIAEGLLDRFLAVADDAQQRAVLEALRWRRFGHGAVDSLAEAWPVDEGRRELFGAAARAAQASGSELGAALFERAVRERAPERRAALVTSAAQALAPELFLELARRPELADADRELCWTLLRGRVRDWSALNVDPWLASDVGNELRSRVVALIGSEHVEAASAATVRLLSRALNDADERITADAFEALCDGPPALAPLEQLARASKRFAFERRVALLRELPSRVVLRPFRADLMELAQSPEHCALAYELLAGLAPDTQIAQLAAEHLQREVEAFAAREDLDEAAAQRTSALVRAVHGQSAGADISSMLHVVERIGAKAVHVTKIAIWSLGQTPEGRARLEPSLAHSASRLRIEAELMLAPHGHRAAEQGLIADFERCDSELRGRAVRACAATDSETGWAFVRDVAANPRLSDALRQLAVDELAARRPPEIATLGRIAASKSWDVAAHATLALGRTKAPEALQHLHAMRRSWSELDPASPEAQATLAAQRESVLVALADADALDGDIERSWLLDALRAAPEQLAARFRGAAQSQAEFQWRVELNVGAALARAHRLAAALEAQATWHRLDGRLLAALAVRAREAGDPNSARELACAALVAFQGEARTEELAARTFELRLATLDIAEAARDWPLYVATATTLLQNRRALRDRDAAFERAFGSFDPERGEDGLARLASAIEQARAWQHVDAGRIEPAREAAGRAGAALGHSRAARDAQDKLDAALASREVK